ncbi:hypothetical protein B0H66DRAFT_343912 [Apodospora peruviana]|uniref:Uncharacterized protein n=1 Tax=Apodospora peruviana TaxID=516989 RepID=A0AAE0M2B9_9PEZI|nr:hypothetical protein B0H66DRAFT_343912 [Apodospora peruviana]
MRRVWSCSSCIGLLFFGLLGREATASLVGEKHDFVHRVAKAQVTVHPVRRDEGGNCPQSAQILCPASLSGGCCPDSYACGTDSCYATTMGVTSACGYMNYYNCPATANGGCCPVGFICAEKDCNAPVGVTDTFTQCPSNYFLCPKEYNGGCCMNGMGCGPDQCYSTAPVTTTITQTVTTTSDGKTITTTKTAVTVATPSPPSGKPTDPANFFPKLRSTSIPKISEIPTKQDVGLSKSQLGGIVGGAVALLVIVVIATIIIIRRLKHVEDVVESRKDSSSGVRTKSQSHAQMEHYGRHLHIAQADMDNTSIDPLMITPNSNNTGSGTGTPQIGGGLRDRSNSDNFPPSQRGRGDSVDAAGRQGSLDSAGYFDIPPRVHNIPRGAQQQMSTAAMRASADSHATGQYSHYGYHHWRQQSNASELSDGSDGVAGVVSPFGVPELDSTGQYAELPSGDHEQTGDVRSRSSSAAAASPRPSFGHARRRSDSNGPRADGTPGGAAGVGGFGPLDVVNESAEVMHGYYGPRNQQTGQTAAGLDVGWDISSPIAPAFSPPLPPPAPETTAPAYPVQPTTQVQTQAQPPPLPPIVHYPQQPGQAVLPQQPGQFPPQPPSSQ